MVLEKEIDTPMGVVKFKGEVTEEEFDYIVKAGLMVLLARGQIHATVVETPDLSDEGPTPGDTIQ